jgi:hypothetical protein
MLGLSKRDWTYIVISALVGFILADLYQSAKMRLGAAPTPYAGNMTG